MTNRATTRLLLTAVLLTVWSCGAPRHEVVHEPDGAVMMKVPATSFVMGTDEAHPDLREQPPGAVPLEPYGVLLARADPAWRHLDERPTHEVTLDAFAIDRNEVTNTQYRQFLDSISDSGDHTQCHPDEPSDKDHTPRYWREFNPLLKDATYAATTPFDDDTFQQDDKPVVGVDWFDAYAYAAWAGKRLPTEAEWELAARWTDARRWPWGNDWQWGLANTGNEKKGQDIPARGFEKDGFIYAAPVGSFPNGRSPIGCDDMAGNVAEWVADWYAADYYRNSPATNPAGPDTGHHRVIRGGSSRNLPSSVRGARRFHYEPEFRNFDLGFRCARDR
jgi:formylglycine-generating enzyme required for sulfatase activity